MFQALVRGMADKEPINLLEADERMVRSSDRTLVVKVASS